MIYDREVVFVYMHWDYYIIPDDAKDEDDNSCWKMDLCVSHEKLKEGIFDGAS